MQEVKNRNIRKRNPRLVWDLLFILLFVACFSTPTNAQVELDFNKLQSIKNRTLTKFAFAKKQNRRLFHLTSEEKKSMLNPAPSLAVRNLPAVYEYRELGFFCKLDLRMDKTMYMPFRFRLGNLEYVNKLEGYWR